MNKKILGIVLGAVLVCAGVAGGAWWFVQQQGGASHVTQAPQLDPSKPSYVALDKVVVMLRPSPERMQNTYLSVDIVFRSDKAHEKMLKGELPMLKGVAVRALSKLDVGGARSMTIEEWSSLISREAMAAYEEQQDQRYFDQVMVSRLIIE